MKLTVIVTTVIFLILFVGSSDAVTFKSARYNCAGSGGLVSFIYIIDIEPRINFYTEDGYSLNSNLCEEQIFRISIENQSGEWIIGEGGYIDSPPIFWLDYLKDFKKENIPAYFTPDLPAGIEGEPLMWENILCEKPKFTSLNVTGAYSLGKNEYGDMLFKVNTTDGVNISFDEDINCMNYYKDVNGNASVFTFMFGGEKPGSILIKNSFKVSKPLPSTNINSLLTDNKLKSRSSTYLKLEVKNIGNTGIIIKDIKLDVDSQLLVCKSMKLPLDSSTECILQISPEQSSIVTGDITYQVYGCGKRYQRAEQFLVGYIEVEATKCSKNSDCLENYICCENECHDSIKGRCLDVNADGVPEWIPMK